MDFIDQKEEKELDDITKKIERLKVSYYQFFMGIEKSEPVNLRNQVEKYFRTSKLNESKRTEVRFRYNGIVQRFRTYSNYWDRTLREIENGKFIRGEIQERIEGEIPIPQPPAEKKPLMPYKELFDEYVKKMTELGKSVEKLNYESFSKKLLKQKEEILKQKGWEDLSYAVIVKDNKVIISAKIKKM